MPRAVSERPRRTVLAAVAVIAVLAIGWLAGSAGSAPRPRAQIRTVVSARTETVMRTVTVPSTPRPTGHHGHRR